MDGLSFRCIYRSVGAGEAFYSGRKPVFPKLCSRDLLEFVEDKKEYEENIRKAPADFTTARGEKFTCRRGESYFQRHRKFPKDLFFDQDGVYAVLMSGRDTTGVLVKKAGRKRLC